MEERYVREMTEAFEALREMTVLEIALHTTVQKMRLMLNAATLIYNTEHDYENCQLRQVMDSRYSVWYDDNRLEYVIVDLEAKKVVTE